MTDITKEDITGIELNAQGTFDHLMKAVKEHLQEEFSSQRIRGTDYSQVYVGSIQTTMQQAIAFELGKGQAAAQTDLTNAQVLIAAEQLISAQKQNELLDCEILKCAKEIELMDKDLELKDASIIQMGHQNDLLEKQVIKMDDEILLLKAQVVNMGFQNIKMEAEANLAIQQLENLKAELDQMLAQISLMQKQEDKLDQDILVAQQEVLKSIQEVLVMEQNVLNSIEQVKKTLAEAELLGAKVVSEFKQHEVLDQQILKMIAEVALMGQKVKTETAQILDQIDGADVAGVIGKKNKLFQRQADGFLRDAEQKMAKIFADMWNVSKSIDGDIVAPIEVLGTPKHTLDNDGGIITEPLDKESQFNKIQDVLQDLVNGVKNAE